MDDKADLGKSRPTSTVASAAATIMPGPRDGEEMVMTTHDVCALWPDARNYQRFRQVCSDEMPATVEAYHAVAGRYLDELAGRGIVAERLAFDPDALAAWAAARGGKVDSRSRAAYAAFLKLERDRPGRPH